MPPKLSSGRLQETVLHFGEVGAILCLSQGFPVPLFRWVAERKISLITVMHYQIHNKQKVKTT